MAQLMTRAEYAAHRGVSRKSVTVWVQAGRIPVEGDGTGRCIDPARADAQLMNSEKRAEAVSSLLGEDPEPLQGGAEPGEAKSLTAHRTMVEATKAQLLQLQLEEKQGRLLPREHVEAEQGEAARRVKKALDAIPSRAEDIYAAGKSGGALGIRKALRQMVRDVEATLSKSMVEAAERIEEVRQQEDGDAAA
ncbi:MAG: hypothetical protein H6873_05585 [Hyphomicrobiaceae bacterium]|nr:hypothetical protein [Hyphomicrobiaceae bacterium]